MNKLVLFGAGKIGRSFIGQLFALSGFEVVFVDIIEPVVRELNRQKGYDVVIKSDQPDVILRVSNVRGVLENDEETVTEEISDADLVAVSVGQKGLSDAVKSIAKGLLLRKKKFGNRPLDIILAENHRNADQFVRKILVGILGKDYPVDDLVGLIETSIGKMVPIMPVEEQKKDPLLVYAEPYNTLILDKKAFKNPIPEVKGLAPKDNIKAWVDRKSHIHNFGHAATAYLGYLADPEVIYLADILNIASVKEFARSAMLQSAEVLIRKYPGEFTMNDLTEHINNLLYRFGNRALGDTVFRVGCDLKRKLQRNDRILGPLIDGIKLGSQVSRILQTFKCGLSFGAKDETGKMFPGDAEFSEVLRLKGLSFVLLNICGLIPETDQKVIDLILSSGSNASSVKPFL